MKITTVRVKEDLAMRLNRLKYQFGYENIDQLIRKLIELATPQLNHASVSSSTEEKGKDLAEGSTSGDASKKEKSE